MSRLRQSKGVTVIEAMVVAVIGSVLVLVIYFAATGGLGKADSYCDGPNMVYENNSGEVQSVAPNDYRCTSGGWPE